MQNTHEKLMAEIRALSNAVNNSNPVKSKPETWIVEQDSIIIKLNIKEVGITVFSFLVFIDILDF